MVTKSQSDIFNYQSEFLWIFNLLYQAVCEQGLGSQCESETLGGRNVALQPLQHRLDPYKPTYLPEAECKMPVKIWEGRGALERWLSG